jgi:hypothetical protein
LNRSPGMAAKGMYTASLFVSVARSNRSER